MTAETLSNPQRITVLGAGSWGTALAHHLAISKKEVRLWGIEDAVLADIAEHQRNLRYFPNELLSPQIQPEGDLAAALSGAELVVLAVPSAATRDVASKINDLVREEVVIVTVAKGLEDGSLKLMTEVIAEEVGHPARVCALSGPSFALEVLRGLPTAVTVVARELETAKTAARAFHHGALRIYTSTDVVGVQLGGAIKNVIALAVGALDGVGMGHNARAALITRGLAEMQRLILALGGDIKTVMGLSGLGDLLLTTTSDLSRNRRVGLRLGRGEKLQAILSDLGQVAEGVETTRKVLALARRHGVEMPIAEEVARLIEGQTTPQESVTALLSRPLRSE